MMIIEVWRGVDHSNPPAFPQVPKPKDFLILSYMKHLILLLFIPGVTDLYGQNIEDKFYGSWAYSYKSNDGVILKHVVWVFEDEGKGSYTNYADSSNKNGITCTSQIPFNWVVSRKNEIFIHKGKADCVCVSAFSQSKAVLERISQSIIRKESGKYHRFNFSFKKDNLLIMGKYKLKKK